MPRGAWTRALLVTLLVMLTMFGVFLGAYFYRYNSNPYARASTREAAAGLRQLVVAQKKFQADYAYHWTADVSELHFRARNSGKPLNFAPKSIALADAAPIKAADDPKPRTGYWFAVIPNRADGTPYADESKVDGRLVGSKTDFAYCSYPEEYPSSGAFTLIVSEAGIVYYRDNKGQRILRWPANPETEGWRMFEEDR